MPLSAGDKLGHYEIADLLGKGGMGEVYRAHDTNLSRDVALKVLPAALAQDPDRLARFEREAKVLAAMNHPNIAMIHGLENTTGSRAIVMELVEGPTLADRLGKGALPLNETLSIARQIAEALEAAHEIGVVHRDLKPANIKVREDGTVKVLDFGLATAMLARVREPGHGADSPTLTVGTTQMGMILGTAAYMAPEQAEGKTVDRRADIWSFGVVLWEMLTGKRLFHADTVPLTLADVLRKELDFTQVPAGTPAPVRELLTRCLDRDVRTRLRDVGEARVAIQRHLANLGSPAPPNTSSGPVKPPLRGGWTWAAGALGIALAAVSVVHFRETKPEAAAVRFQIPPPEKTLISSAPYLSPDGRRIAFVVNVTAGTSLIGVRSLDSLEVRFLAGTEAAANDLFWSPDSRWIGFVSGGKLRKIEASGGPPQTLCDAPAFRGGAWSQNGVILFNDGAPTLSRVPQAGGSPSPVEQATPGEGHIAPWFLPDGQRYIYLAQATNRERSAIYLASLDTKEKKQLLAADRTAVYAPPLRAGEPGHLLFGREGVLMAQSLDPKTFDPAGEAVVIADHVGTTATGRPAFSASANGALAYFTGGPTKFTVQLTWFDRAGKALGNVGPAAEYNDLSLSPDGSRVAVTRNYPGAGDIYVIDVAGNTVRRLTFDPAQDWDPVWSPDGRRIVFASQRASGGSRPGIDGVDQLYWKNSDGTGNEQPLVPGATVPQRPKHWSADGKWLLFRQGQDLWTLPMDPQLSAAERKPLRYFESPFDESQGQFSSGVAPDQRRWIAYTTNEGGMAQVYVQSFPVGSGKFQVSNSGGVEPRWSRDGKELFYISLDRKLMAVDIRTSPVWSPGEPRELFQTKILGGGGFANVFRYDVSPDGKRFLILAETGNGSVDSTPITVVLNWQAELKK